jgi:hypothetical protein
VCDSENGEYSYEQPIGAQIWSVTIRRRVDRAEISDLRAIPIEETGEPGAGRQSLRNRWRGCCHDGAKERECVLASIFSRVAEA